MATRNPTNSPVEGQVVYPIIYKGLGYIQTVVGNGISEPSTVSKICGTDWLNKKQQGVNKIQTTFFQFVLFCGVIVEITGTAFGGTKGKLPSGWQTCKGA